MSKKKLKESVIHNKSIEIYKYSGTKHGFASNYEQMSQEISFKSDLARTKSLSILRKVIGPYQEKKKKLLLALFSVCIKTTLLIPIHLILE
ncbi:hypothetical protein Glove_402g32 [Diversispora epigaea]|uniref:Uncharacterized protein n=1 Tax=Diversispora epigaea TaxID=1348612 RepID=A0A397GZQ5_9GLOM|nr:hypothetical protein Glove_402g32 [Diversispora epigaea]